MSILKFESFKGNCLIIIQNLFPKRKLKSVQMINPTLMNLYKPRSKKKFVYFVMVKKMKPTMCVK